MTKTCPECNSGIIKGKCQCGEWRHKSKLEDPFRKMGEVLEWYGKSNDGSPISGSHHTGCAFIIFRGDINTCDKLKEYLKTLDCTITQTFLDCQKFD